MILGDRYELLGCAIASMSHRIPIAHIHGGEVTRGAIDDSIRHSISKLSHLHFPIHSDYKKRLIQLGEDPKQFLILVDWALIQLRKLNLNQNLN